MRKLRRTSIYRVILCSLALALPTLPALAQEVNITPDMASHSINLNGERVVIERIQDTSHRLSNDFTKTSRPCPPFCIHPISAAPGVDTIGEIEVMEFLENTVATGQGLLIDSRVPSWYQKGTIPGAVNVPFSTLEASNPYRDEILKALGARQTTTGWDFSNALDLAMFCNGPWCDQSPRAIRNLTQAGYPAEKIKYYRGGMQLWLLLGLTVRHPIS
ncbi:rhodanese-like domain-containing protein [Aliisedimentitalea sp. MJ-SS2]|uniref:rhodanese-like domain-containing protein n=1 Tax=Aliisedimentitalea sp. MJ-SS2 TaxID=3049795 RepID=UPI002930D7A0|nr:rhodanese-like domain-containing protein [Alisedimentitalea sp. MJ-SS2]